MMAIVARHIELYFPLLMPVNPPAAFFFLETIHQSAILLLAFSGSVCVTLSAAELASAATVRL